MMKRLAETSFGITYQEVSKIAKKIAQKVKGEAHSIRKNDRAGEERILFEIDHPSFNDRLEFEFIFFNIEDEDGSSVCIAKNIMRVYDTSYSLDVSGSYQTVKNHVYFKRHKNTDHFGQDLDKVLGDIWETFYLLLERDFGFEYQRNGGNFIKKFSGVKR